MKKINTTLFDLAEIYETMSLADIFMMLNELYDIKEIFQSTKEDLNYNKSNIGITMNVISEIEQLDIQINYLDRNIRTFEDAMMCHETKIFENRTSLKDLSKFCLN